MNTTVTRTDPEARRISKLVRSKLGMSGSTCPIEFVDGFAKPKVIGRPGYYTTATGKPVYHANAYRRAWGKPVYHASTLKIVVGAGWVCWQLNIQARRRKSS